MSLNHRRCVLILSSRGGLDNRGVLQRKNIALADVRLRLLIAILQNVRMSSSLRRIYDASCVRVIYDSQGGRVIDIRRICCINYCYQSFLSWMTCITRRTCSVAGWLLLRVNCLRVFGDDQGDSLSVIGWRSGRRVEQDMVVMQLTSVVSGQYYILRMDTMKLELAGQNLEISILKWNILLVLCQWTTSPA